MARIIGSIIAYAMFVGVVVAMVCGIMFLVHSIQCIIKPVNMYEHFDDVVQQPDVKQRIESYLLGSMIGYTKQITNIANTIQSKFPDQIDGIEDKTCKVYASVKDSFIKNKTEMQDASEMDMTPEDRKKLSDRRLQRGANQFDIRKNLYVAQHKTPLYECFDSQNELDAAKSELDEKTEELHGFITSADFQKRTGAVDGLRATIGLNLTFLNETLRELIKSSEGFANVQQTVTDAELRLPFSLELATNIQKTYVESIRKAMSVIKSVLAIPQLRSNILVLYSQQNEIWDTINTKKKNLETMSSDDAKKMADDAKQKAAK